MNLRAVLFDVDFTLVRPGPELGPEGYRRRAEEFGLVLDPARYEEARAAAVGALERLGVQPEEAAMVGDSLEDDVEGARALGMRAFLVDRENRFPEVEGRLRDLYALPAALDLPGPG